MLEHLYFIILIVSTDNTLYISWIIVFNKIPYKLVAHATWYSGLILHFCTVVMYGKDKDDTTSGHEGPEGE